MADTSGDVRQMATPRQMALELFEDMFAEGQAIHEAGREVGFQRNNVFAQIVDMGLTARRFIDAAYFIVSSETEPLEQYEVDLSYFKWLMRYDSRNIKHLRSVVNEAQNAKLQVTETPDDREPHEDDFWGQVQLIGMVTFPKGRIKFDVHKKLVPHIRDPRTSHWLSLRISTAFTRSLGRAIYDRVLPWVPAGRTEWIPLETMRAWPGKMGANAAIFKYFKRDWLEPAVKEINEVSDIELSYETRTESTSSKKIDRIRFVLKRKDTADAVLASLAEASELYLTLKNEFELSTRQFSTIAENRETWTDSRIQQAVEYTRFKIEQGLVKRSPAGYLMGALRDNWRVSGAERKMVAVQAQLEVAEDAEKEVKAVVSKAVADSTAVKDLALRATINEAILRGREHFEAADVKTRRDLTRSFLASPLDGKTWLRRLPLEASEVSEANIMTIHKDMATAFCQFVSGKLPEAVRPAR
jgi:hypothetical protein